MVCGFCYGFDLRPKDTIFSLPQKNIFCFKKTLTY